MADSFLQDNLKFIEISKKIFLAVHYPTILLFGCLEIKIQVGNNAHFTTIFFNQYFKSKCSC